MVYLLIKTCYAGQYMVHMGLEQSQHIVKVGGLNDWIMWMLFVAQCALRFVDADPSRTMVNMSAICTVLPSRISFHMVLPIVVLPLCFVITHLLNPGEGVGEKGDVSKTHLKVKSSYNFNLTWNCFFQCMGRRMSQFWLDSHMCQRNANSVKLIQLRNRNNGCHIVGRERNNVTSVQACELFALYLN